MSKLDDMCRVLVDELLASVDNVTGEWKPSWASGSWLPHNVTTMNPYKGMNVLQLWAAAARFAFPSPEWATYKQWLTLDAQVRKGEHGTHCLKWNSVTDKKDPTRSRLVPSSFVVFNAAQVDGYAPAEPVDVRGPGLVAFWEAFDLVPIKVITGDPAFVPALDVVMMPPPTSFTCLEAYAATFAHEAAHWTGHSSRLNRLTFKRWGDDEYAAEELVAEISAALTCAWFGLPPERRRDNHARYIKHWLHHLNDDPTLLVGASQAAQKATDYLLAFANTATSTTEIEEAA